MDIMTKKLKFFKESVTTSQQEMKRFAEGSFKKSLDKKKNPSLRKCPQGGWKRKKNLYFRRYFRICFFFC